MNQHVSIDKIEEYIIRFNQILRRKGESRKNYDKRMMEELKRIVKEEVEKV